MTLNVLDTSQTKTSLLIHNAGIKRQNVAPPWFRKQRVIVRNYLAYVLTLECEVQCFWYFLVLFLTDQPGQPDSLVFII